ncbi:MAG TPA: MMPL family transporter [Thermoleophilaceae bacterium]|nr:MMPL family transporter [Thermoleophilaceae bacterium]
MATHSTTTKSPSNHNLAARVGRWSVQHRRKAILGWLAFVFVAMAVGFNLVPQKNIEQMEGMPGESGKAGQILNDAYPDKATEQVLVQSKTLGASDPQFRAAVADVTQRLEKTGGVGKVDPAVISKDGHSALVAFELPGKADVTEKSVVDSLAAVDAAQKAHPELRIDETGDASISKAELDKSNEEMGSAMFMSLGLTLIILLFTFGALVAAGIPVLLGLTSVLATLGLLGPVSQLAPVDASVMHVVLLVGMAVGVDYSLFYVKREREERAAGRDANAAIEAAAATSGRAVVISGFTVMVAMAGMYMGGIANFASFATGTIMVVAVAVVGSLTVLPATLSKLGHRVEKGRVPLLGRLRDRAGRVGIWSRVLDRVLRRPLVSAVVATGVLLALAAPTLGIETSLGGTDSSSREIEEMRTYDRVNAAFPSEGGSEIVVIKADDATAAKVVSAIGELRAETAARPALFEGKASVELSSDRTVASVTVPTVGEGTDELSNKAVDALRGEIVPTTVGQVDGVEAYTSGEAAATRDFNDTMTGNLPYVFAFVLSAAFLLLLFTFRSIVIPIKAIALNLLSVGAAYGLLVTVFQHGLGVSLGLGEGPIAAWLPLFLFVILFGLSMDYHVFILTRIREAFDRGMSTGDAVAHGIKSTAGVVTSAAIVMVGVFAMFATSSELQMQQMGIGLAAAVLIDATIIRGVLLPATMKLLGDWNWYLPRRLGWLPQVTTEPEVKPAYG